MLGRATGCVRLQSQKSMRVRTTMTNHVNGQSVTGGAVEPTGKNGFSLISDEKLIDLYTNLLKCRVFEQRAASVLKQDSPTVNHSAIGGFEAAFVGVAIDLVSEDTISFCDSEYLIGLIKGVPLGTIFGALAANGRPHRPSAPPGSSDSDQWTSFSQTAMNSAIGAALAHKTAKHRKVTVVFARDGVDDSWREALEIARVNGLPMIFVCRENPNAAAKARSQAIRNVEEPLFPSITVDESDVVAVYRVGYEAIARARQGRGPTLIDCQPFRPAGQLKAKRNTSGKIHASQDSIRNMEGYLRGKGLFSPPLKKKIVAGFTKELDAAIDRIQNGAIL
jgi:TPP-dependent pyruvate/acetoin dehydrogenase alpha subunit